MAQKNTEIRLPRRMRANCKVIPFSVTKELSLENYLGNPCTKFGENRRW